MRFAKFFAVALAAACATVPAQAAQVFLTFGVYATGTKTETFTVPVGQEPGGATCSPANNGSYCSLTTPAARYFQFNQNFDFTAGTALYNAGSTVSGATSFRLTDLGAGRYQLSNFLFLIDRTGPQYTNWYLETLTAPSQVVGVPEPATWLSLILGFGLLGAATRGRRQAAFSLNGAR